MNKEDGTSRTKSTLNFQTLKKKGRILKNIYFRMCNFRILFYDQKFLVQAVIKFFLKGLTNT